MSRLPELERSLPAELGPMLEDVLDAAMALQGADFGDIQLYDAASLTLGIVAHRGLGPAFLDYFATVDASDTSACGLALKAGKRVVIQDVHRHRAYAPHRAIAAATGYRAVYSTPLFEREGSQPVGMLSILFREPHRPSPREMRLTDLLARQASDLIASRLAEQRLGDSEKHLRLALSAGRMGTWDWDAQADLMTADAVHRALFDLPPDDRAVPLEVYTSRMDAEEHRIDREDAFNALADWRAVEVEQRVFRPNGEIRWIVARGFPKSGDARGMIGVSYDVTARVRREQRLRESEAKLSAILKQVPGAIGLFDAAGRLLLRGGPLGHVWDDAIPSRDPGSDDRWRGFDADGALLDKKDYPGARALRGETVAPGVDFLHTGLDGRRTWVRVSAAPFRDDAGGIAGAVAMLQDVDKEKRAERRVRESEARLKAAAVLAKLGLYSWDPQTNEIVWDEKVKALWGLPADAAVDYAMWRAAVHPDDLPRVEAAIARSVDVEDGIYDAEYRVVGIADGVERWVATRGMTHFDGGKPVYFYGVAIDVTDRKRVEAALERRADARTRELEAANASLSAEMAERRGMAERLDLLQAELFHATRLSIAGELAASLAHELSQPLAAVLNSLNATRRLLASDPPSIDANVRELIEDAGVQAERAGEIIRRLRDFLRRGEANRRAEPVRPLIEEAAAFAMTGQDRQSVSIRFDFDPSAAYALVDRIQIQQVVANLVRNAVEAMRGSRKRELLIVTRAGPGDMIAIKVADTAPGIREDMREGLFEPFKSTKPGGMGLGLSICRSIVEAHGGRIAYAPRPGGGSIICFTLEAVSGKGMGA